ncbi:MAG: SDR family NAD(P)-dependent oxidoreductase [Acidimicrobiales bacterium]
MDLELTDRVVIATGASSGIGQATVGVLLEEGAKVVACARDQTRLSASVDQLDPSRVPAVPGDVTSADEMTGLVATTLDRFDRLDGVACLAGRAASGHALDLTAKQWAIEIDDKISGVMNLVRAACPELAATAGRIVTLTAPTARDPAPPMAAVSAGRASIASLTRSLALDLADEGIAGNSVSVGLIDTPLQRERHRP